MIYQKRSFTIWLQKMNVVIQCWVSVPRKAVLSMSLNRKKLKFDTAQKLFWKNIVLLLYQFKTSIKDLFFLKFMEDISPFLGTTDTSVLDFKWRLPWVSKPIKDLSLHHVVQFPLNTTKLYYIGSGFPFHQHLNPKIR